MLQKLVLMKRQVCFTVGENPVYQNSLVEGQWKEISKGFLERKSSSSSKIFICPFTGQFK